MSLEAKKWIIAILGGLFLLSLILVQWIEVLRRRSEAGLDGPHAVIPASSKQCVECHQNITQVPHEKVTVQVSCVNCHESLAETAKDEGKTEQAKTLAKVLGQIDQYMGSIHSRPNKQDQSRTNATCYNCHDAHYVYPAGTPNYNWWRLNLPYTCGKCHEAELAAYKESVHGREVLLNGNAAAAVCSDCHTGMNVQDTSKDATQIAIVQRCGSCHKEQYASYLDTYHGQVNKLGFTYTAKCANCCKTCSASRCGPRGCR